MYENIGKIHEYGFIAPTTNENWAAAPLIVAKDPPEKLRLTFDYRPVNLSTESLPETMLNIESEISDVTKRTVFEKIDFVSGYWQLTLGMKGQKYLSLMKTQGVWKPLRSTKGAKNSDANLQEEVEPYFGSPRDNCKAWLDDLLIHAVEEEHILKPLERVWETCRRRKLNISARK